MWFLPSFLTPTFFVLGLAAITLPVLFHFFRRTPKGNLPFSTLMFLRRSPPRLTSRSKVDNWLLLILRGLILLFVALAFGRVFFRQTDFVTVSDLPGRRIAILVDTSASMNRGDLWEQARESIQQVIKDLGPNDQAAVFTFDNRLKTIIGFQKGDMVNVSARRELMAKSLDNRSPGWSGTNLGSALGELLGILSDDSDSSEQELGQHIILISDLQAGITLRDLQTRWPEHVSLETRTLTAESNNATLRILDESLDGPSLSIGVRVSNVPESTESQFELNWLDINNNPVGLAATVVVPPGKSRIIRIRKPDFSVSGIELTGDSNDFDNRFFLSAPKQVPERILFLGEDESVRSQIEFFVRKSLKSMEGSGIEFVTGSEFQGRTQCDVAFVTGQLEEETAAALHQFARDGGLVCVVVTQEEMQDTIARLTNEKTVVSEAKVDDFVLLAKIDFASKLFIKFADPNFSNFSSIHFWKYRKCLVENCKPIASFDNGDLAVGTLRLGERPMYLFASGWHASDSQLGLSRKFVGLMLSMILKQTRKEVLAFETGEEIEFASLISEKDFSLKRSDGSEIADVDRPGIYQVSSATQSKTFAVNIPYAESQTGILDVELLENKGIELGTMESASKQVEIERQRRDEELESRQKLWRWMLIIAMFVIVIETVLSGHYSRKQIPSETSSQE